MSEKREADQAPFGAEQLTRLAELEISVALIDLERRGLHRPSTAAHLADAALQQAETATKKAARWLELADALNRAHDDDPNLRAQIQYAQARLHVHTADLAAAETMLRRAQRNWQRGGDVLAYNRSFLGLTQILAMQGRYTAAEDAIQQAIDNLLAAVSAHADVDAEVLQLTATAHRNFATLLTYQEKHAAALSEYERAQECLERLQSTASQDAEMAAHLRNEMAHISLNRANALMFLDRPAAAVALLHEAIELFDRADDAVNRGRARTNLGTLYLRTGRYAASLAEFDKAAADLLDDALLQELSRDAEQPEFAASAADGAVPTTAEARADDMVRLRQADLLLLERAHAYVALNLLPEALLALTQCETLFRRANQPYELGQSLYIMGLLYVRTQDFAQATKALQASEQVFAQLGNTFWLNRTRSARAVLAYQQGEVERAADQLSVVLADLERARIDTNQAVLWDIQTLAEARLLQIQLALTRGQVAAARRTANTLTSELAGVGAPPTAGTEQDDRPSTAASGSRTVFLPHLSVRLEHMLGRIEAAAGRQRRARHHYRLAIDRLESQRASLPLEEVRTAFLDDKMALYADLVRNLLHESTRIPTLISTAFNIAERGRARTLLERLETSTAAGPSVTIASGGEPSVETRRQRVHWLYNRLFGEQAPRHVDAQQLAVLQSQERALHRLEQRSSALRTQAQPVQVTALQEILQDDEQALVYYMADDEVLCFLVDSGHLQVTRHLCSAAELERAQAELRFQLGRIELGEAYYKRHAARLQQALRDALHRLYRLLVTPLASLLHAARLLVIPYGSLHLLPFHALWDGAAYLIERFECRYAPSASIAVHCRKRTSRFGAAETTPMTSLAGLAISDPAIPAARREAQLAAAHFTRSWLYLDDAASYANLQNAAGQADILHVATHGLFRPDNPFFSALKLADGWIDVWQIYRLPLTARLVVLSACESGAGAVRGGDELIGLARGFLGAGAQALLVSLWTVHDASAVQLMDRFYAHLTEEASVCHPAEILRLAQLDAIREQWHPYFWAPFFLTG